MKSSADSIFRRLMLMAPVLLVAACGKEQQEALFAYKGSIQNAFADVATALVDRSTSLERLSALRAEVRANANYARLARLRYENGYTSYIEVLDAESKLFASQLALTAQQGQVLTASVNLHQAMGGGWVGIADSKTSSGDLDKP